MNKKMLLAVMSVLIVCIGIAVLIQNLNEQEQYNQALKKGRLDYFKTYEKSIKYNSIQQENKAIEKGKKVVYQKGKNGKCLILELKVSRDDIVYRKQLNQTLIEPSLDEIVYVGTKEIEKPSEKAAKNTTDTNIKKNKKHTNKSKKVTVSQTRQYDEPVKSVPTKIQGQVLESMSRESFNKINQFRKENNMRTLVWDQRIFSATTQRAQEITQKFAHIRPNGRQWHSVTHDLATENLAYGFGSSSSLVQSWIDSDGHRKNLLNPHANKGAVTMLKSSNGTIYSTFLAGW